MDCWRSDLATNYFPNPVGLCTEKWRLYFSILYLYLYFVLLLVTLVTKTISFIFRKEAVSFKSSSSTRVHFDKIAAQSVLFFNCWIKTFWWNFYIVAALLIWLLSLASNYEIHISIVCILRRLYLLSALCAYCIIDIVTGGN